MKEVMVEFELCLATGSGRKESDGTIRKRPLQKEKTLLRVEWETRIVHRERVESRGVGLAKIVEAVL